MPQPHLERLADRNDPNSSSELWEVRYNRACTEFTTKKISTDVFRAYLHALGFRGQEMEAEINLHWPKL